MKKCETNGTITVFLSLILLIILSLLFTIIEGARVYSARVMAERALTTAMDSVWAEYYGPLWDEYHIFGRYFEGDMLKAQQDSENKLSGYLENTIDPKLEAKGSDVAAGTELYHLSVKELKVSEGVTLVDYKGQILINEAIEYMKYQKLGEGAEVLLNKLKLLQTPNQVSYLMDEKQELQEELVEIDKGILKLMKLFDGIETSDKGIKLTRQGKLQTTKYFIKKICIGDITMQQVGINQQDVFAALKEAYVNPGIHFRKIESCYAGIEEARAVIEAARAQISADLTAISVLSRSLAETSNTGNKKGDKKKENERKDNINRQIQSLYDSIQRKETLITSKENVIREGESQIRAESSSLRSLIQNTKPLIAEAIKCIHKLQLKVKVAAPLLANYEALLTQEKDNLEASTYAGLEEGLTELKKYMGSGNLSYDFDAMEQILEKNERILEQTEAKLAEGEQSIFNGDKQKAALAFRGAEDSLNSYQLSGLTLDYSTLVLDQSNQESLLEKVQELASSGLVSLVIDPETVSKAKLNSLSAMPSDLASLSQDSIDPLSSLKDYFQDTGKNNPDSNKKSLFQNMSDETSFQTLLGAGINKIAEIYLFEEYLRDHFYDYSMQKKEQKPVAEGSQYALAEIEETLNNKVISSSTINSNTTSNSTLEDNVSANEEEKVSSNLKPSVLKYEQEYLIAGKESDRDNLYSVILRVILIRTILDFITVLSDSTAREEARAAAVAIVGFTGLPILIGAVQVMVMIAWALEEALFDTCVLLNGKEVPIIKRKTTLLFHELFLISRIYLEKKAQDFPGTTELSFGYQNYLQLFLISSKETNLAYRSMDLMQKNIGLRYAVEAFEIDDCYFGYQAEAEFEIRPIFTEFSFIQRYIPQNTQKYRFQRKAEYSY